MRRTLRLLVIAAALLWPVASPTPAPASPESGVWVNASSGDVDTLVEFGDTVVFTLSGGTDSTLVTVTTTAADLCFDPDTGGSAGSARISVYRPVNPATATINGSILLPSQPVDNSDCVQLVRGTYWVEVTTAPTGGEVAVVSITGRNG